MCNIKCILFGAINLTMKDVEGKRVIEIGSNDVNGSLRPLIESWKPSEYIGIDLEYGNGVDIRCKAEDIVNVFGKESFDIIISTEVIEHVKNWRLVIDNIKSICKPNGLILITTRSKGFEYHGWPHDFWRFEVSDMKNIFSDFYIKKLESDDISTPGVFIIARKPYKFNKNDLYLSKYNLYSITENKRISYIEEKNLRLVPHNYYIKQKATDIIYYVGRIILNIFEDYDDKKRNKNWK